MFRFFLLVLAVFCRFGLFGQEVSLPLKSNAVYSGAELKKQFNQLTQPERDSLTIDLFMKGNFPSFLERATEIKSTYVTADGQVGHASYYVLNDYIALGTDNDFIRLPMTPNSAQRLADSLGFYLSNSKICDDIYALAAIKLEPIPMVDNRTSFVTFIEHHNRIETQRQGRLGLIAGIKKDVISTDRLVDAPGMVAIYGWHRMDGKPIQPVYTKHADYYVDYSHGIRLVYPYLFVNGDSIHFDEAMKNDTLRPLISKENSPNYYKYSY